MTKSLEGKTFSFSCCSVFYIIYASFIPPYKLSIMIFFQGKFLYKLKAAIVKDLEKNTELIEIAAATLLKQKCVQNIFSENQEKVSYYPF